MSRRRLRVDSTCPYCKKRVYEPPKGMKTNSDEYRYYYNTEVQYVETRTRITAFHRSCYLDTIRNGGSSLG